MSETDAIPEFKAKGGRGGSDVGITNMSALTAGPGIKSLGEVIAILLVEAHARPVGQAAKALIGGHAVDKFQQPAVHS